MTAQTYQLITNPWVVCAGCGDEVRGRLGGEQNLPCGCVAGVESVCPTWDREYGCQCGNIDAAEALQEAIEAEQARPWPHLVEVDRLFHVADRFSWRGVGWVALVAGLSVVMLLIGQTGAGW